MYRLIQRRLVPSVQAHSSRKYNRSFASQSQHEPRGSGIEYNDIQPSPYVPLVVGIVIGTTIVVSSAFMWNSRHPEESHSENSLIMSNKPQQEDYSKETLQLQPEEQDLRVVYHVVCRPKEPRSLDQRPVHCQVDCGEDSFFIQPKEHSIDLGVVDGVGGWRKRGIDPSQFACALTHYASLWSQAETSEIQNQKNNETPLKTMNYAYEEILNSTEIVGSATATFATIDQKNRIVRVAHVGDSGLRLWRQGQGLVYSTMIQQSRFNAPFQLTAGPFDKSPRERSPSRYSPEKDAQVESIPIERGDLLLMATDGILDNVFDKEWESIVKQNMPKTLNEMETKLWIKKSAQDILQRAIAVASDKQAYSPFSEAANKAGKSHLGGKMDDMTLLIACVI